MKKTCLFILMGILGLFSACHNDDDPTPVPEPEPEPRDAAYIAEGEYVVTTIGTTSTGTRDIFTEQSFHISKVADNLIKIETDFMRFGTSGKPDYINLGTIEMDSIPVTAISDSKFTFAGTDSLKYPNSIKNTQATIKGSFSDKVLQAEITLDGETVSIYFKFDGQQVQNNVAEILSMKIESDLIGSQPELSSGVFTIFVKPGTDLSKLLLAPELQLSKGAISNPASGETVDFSKAIDKGEDTEYVVYTVVSEDRSTKKTYRVKVQMNNNLAKSSFVEWENEKTPDGTVLDNYFKPKGDEWATSNMGIYMINTFAPILGLPTVDGALVYETAGQSAKGAAVKTANTIGKATIMPGWMPNIPKITSGSLFLGSFETDIQNTLKSTKFGLPYFQKPVKVKGYYKYTPGTEYYLCEDPVNAAHITKLDENKTDECALSAVLYEVSSFTDTEEYLTGLDIFTSDKVVAIAQLFSGEQDSFKEFELTLNYKKAYDPAKKYRFAVIFSSSKDGDKFSGAPDSELVIDEVEIINE